MSTYSSAGGDGFRSSQPPLTLALLFTSSASASVCPNTFSSKDTDSSVFSAALKLHSPIRSNAVQFDPTQSNSVQCSAARSNSIQCGPIRSDSSRCGPIRSGAVRFVSICSESCRCDQIRCDPAQFRLSQHDAKRTRHPKRPIRTTVPFHSAPNGSNIPSVQFGPIETHEAYDLAQFGRVQSHPAPNEHEKGSPSVKGEDTTIHRKHDQN